MTTFVVIILDDSSAFEFTDSLCPRIATLRKNSIVFPNLYTHPVCTLSRTGFMFGSYGKKIGHIDETPTHVFPTHPYPSLASVMAANGYATCLVGKWHGGVDPLYIPVGQPGYVPGSHDLPYVQAPITRGYQEWRAGVIGNLGEGASNGYNDWQRIDATSSGYTVTPGVTTYAPEAQIAEVVDWIADTGGVGSGTNRFLHIALNLPHAPFHVPTSTWLAGYNGETGTNRGKYLAMLRACDTAVNLILAAVGSSAHAFLWSDNGSPDSAPPPGVPPAHLKRSSHKEGSNVLGVFRRIGVDPQVSPRLMHAIDIPATILSVAGIALPTEWDSSPFGRPFVLTERQEGNEKDRSCRTGCYLLRELTDAASVVTEELYYLPADPDELSNVIANPRHAGALAYLRARLAAAAL